jgi:hypothetical protein
MPLHLSLRRGPSGSMTPSELHLGQYTELPAQATLAPLIDLFDVAEMTFPPAVVLAPTVM